MASEYQQQQLRSSSLLIAGYISPHRIVPKCVTLHILAETFEKLSVTRRF
jgi:hypothetical protein